VLPVSLKIHSTWSKSMKLFPKSLADDLHKDETNQCQHLLHSATGKFVESFISAFCNKKASAKYPGSIELLMCASC